MFPSSFSFASLGAVPFLGEGAALGTALCWSLTSIFFTIASARLGAIVLNRLRLLLAVVFLASAHFVVFGAFLPPLEGYVGRWIWLGLSGILGLAIGDGCLFFAFTRIGPRKSMILMSTVPILSAVLAWAYLGEAMTPREILGVFTVVFGVVIVVAERSAGAAPVDRKSEVLGVLGALGGAVSQAVSLVIAKEGMALHDDGTTFSPLSATLVRMIVAAAAAWLVAVLARDVRRSTRGFVDRKALPPLLGGTVFGPFLGVWLSLVAVHHAAVGIATSLMALVPVFVIPWVIVFFKERVSVRAVFGTLIAVGGVVLLLVG